MAQETVNLRIDFVDENNHPYEAKRVVISNGQTKLTYENVTTIQDQVPANFSLRVVWTSGEYDTMEHIPLSLQPNRDYNFKFYCLNREEVVQQTRPYILLAEEGAEPELNWNWDENNKRLTAEINKQENTIVDVAVWVDTRLTERPNSAMTAAVSNAGVDDWSVCIPPNVNITGSFSIAEGTLDYSFTEIDNSKQLVGIRKATYNDFIIDTYDKEPFQTELRTLDGTIVDSNIYWPQYAVDPLFYHIKAKQLPDEFFRLSLPLKVEIDKVNLFELYPPKKDEVDHFTFLLAAEYYHTRATINSVNHNSEENEISAYTSASGDQLYSNGYFGTFILPADKNVNSVKYTDNAGTETDLQENEDYILEELENKIFCTVRIPINSVKVTLQYT